MSTQAIVTHLDHFQRRVVQDAVAAGSAGYWGRRARMFEWARPRPTDFHGLATRADLQARDAALVEVIAACHARAATAVLGVVA